MIEGETCRLTGYAVGESCFGRSRIIDVTAQLKNGRPEYRQIDYRTLNWIIVDGTKYQMSGKSNQPAVESENYDEVAL